MVSTRHTIAAAGAAACLFAASCSGSESQHEQASNAANAAQKQPVPQIPIPVPQPPLGREQLLIAALRAASDFAAGQPDSKLQQGLADRKFEFRERFGCDGPGRPGSKRPFDWSYNDKTGALKVRATPELSPKDAAVAAIAGEAFETVEGFWVPKPWLLSAACPKKAQPPAGQAAKAAQAPEPATATAEPAAAPPAPRSASAWASPHTVAIAQFFTATGPRTMRRSGRAYEATKKLEDGELPKAGFDLVVSGRLVALPDGRVIACTAAGAGERPACIVSVEFGTVSIERADTHEQLAQWGSG